MSFLPCLGLVSNPNWHGGRPTHRTWESPTSFNNMGPDGKLLYNAPVLCPQWATWNTNATKMSLARRWCRANPMAASRYAEGVIGATGRESLDLSGVLRGDQWAISRTAEAGMNVPPRMIDTGTGLSAWTDPRTGTEYGQQDLWNIRDQSHTLQYQSQQWSLNQQQSQFNVNQAMQFGGSFVNPMTGQNQNIQYGQFDISDALFGISVNQQYDAFAYQQQQLSMSSKYQRQNLESNREQTTTRLDWRVQDWEYQENRSQLQFGWQMEDYDEPFGFHGAGIDSASRASVIGQSSLSRCEKASRVSSVNASIRSGNGPKSLRNARRNTSKKTSVFRTNVSEKIKATLKSDSSGR